MFVCTGENKSVFVIDIHIHSIVIPICKSDNTNAYPSSLLTVICIMGIRPIYVDNVSII